LRSSETCCTQGNYSTNISCQPPCFTTYKKTLPNCFSQFGRVALFSFIAFIQRL